MFRNRHIFGFVIIVFTYAAVVLFTAGCGRQQAEIEQKKNKIRLIIEEAWNKGNLAVLDEFFSADYICHQIPYKDRNIESYKELWEGFRAVYPDTKCDINSIVAEGDKVTVLATYNGTNKKTGKKVTGPGLILFRWKEGKIVESWDIWDELGYFRQLGYKMSPPITQTTFAMVTVAQLKPGNMEDLVKLEKEMSVPLFKSYKEFRGFYFMSDVKTGKVCGISLWDNQESVIEAMQSEKVKVYFQEFTDKTKDFFKVKPTREDYTVMMQE